MTSMTIVEFLTARIAEDEALAIAERERLDQWATDVAGAGIVWTEWQIGPGSPRHLLAECAAKRTIISEITEHRDFTYATNWDSQQTATFLDTLLASMAATYSDHPDYATLNLKGA